MLTLRCSGAAGWSRCGGKPHLENLPNALANEDHDAAREGTAAAWVAECIINGDATVTDDMVGRVHSNGVEISLDIARHVQGYVNILQSRHSPKAEVLLGLPSSDYSFQIAGTADGHSWSGPDDFHIDDLKYGYGIIEPTTEQLTAYALLAYYVLGIRAARWHLGIYQPRAQHPLGSYRVRTLTLAQIEQEIQALWQAATRAANSTLATPGRVQCAHCLAAAKCTALTHSVYSLWQPLQSRSYLEPTNQQLADELEFLEQASDLIKARSEAVRAEAMARIVSGQQIPGWGKMPNQGNRKFKYPGWLIKLLTGIDASNVTECTPAELERRGANKETVNLLTTRPVVSYKLERYNPDKIGAMFK